MERHQMQEKTINISPIQTAGVRYKSLNIWTMLTVALLFSAVLKTHTAQAENFDQYQAKAIFLYNLTHFISWPMGEDQNNKQLFTIVVLGHDSLGTYLNDVAAGELADGRRIVIKRYYVLEQLRQQPCDLLFVSKDQMALWPQIRAVARQHAILTVSDMEGFAHRGGIINLLTSDRKIQIEINIEEARRNGFEFSAKLLRLARIINSKEEK